MLHLPSPLPPASPLRCTNFPGSYWSLVVGPTVHLSRAARPRAVADKCKSEKLEHLPVFTRDATLPFVPHIYGVRGRALFVLLAAWQVKPAA